MTISLYYGQSTPDDPWEKLLAVSESGILEADEIISRSYRTAAPALNAANFVRLSGPHGPRAYEAVLSVLENELRKLCYLYDYRQMLFVSRLCIGLPIFRHKEADFYATRLRGQAADRWVLKCSARSLDTDYMQITEDSYSIGDPPDSLYVDVVKLHRLAEFHQRTVLEFMRFNFLRLASSENKLSGPAMVIATVKGKAAIGVDCSNKDAYFAAHLFEHRLGNYYSILSNLGLSEFQSEGKPLAMIYEYNDIDKGPYGGGILFKPDALPFDSILRYGQMFSTLFERDVGMPVEHFWALCRGLYKLAIDAHNAGGGYLAPWGLLTGTLPISREDITGSPLKEAARHEFEESFPELHSNASLNESVEKFVRLASYSQAEPADPDATWRERAWVAESARVPAYPYIIYGEDSHELWIVDYFRTIPFIQGVMSKLRFSPSSNTTGSQQSDAYERTSIFDHRVAEMLDKVPRVATAFAEYRETASLPNAKFCFDSGAQEREIDVPVRVGKVLIAVQTWAREVDLRIFEGDYKALKRRWKLVKGKLKATDELYTDYLLGHPEGRRNMEKEGLRYVLPVLCGPYEEPAVSFKPEDWLHLPVTLSPDKVGKAVPRVLTPTELEDFLRDTTEKELVKICEENRWTL